MIANANKGDIVAVRLTNNSIMKIEINEIKTYGIEGFNKNLTTKPLTFFPFHNIISVSKITK